MTHCLASENVLNFWDCFGDYCLGFYLYTASMRAGASKGMGEEKEAEITKALLVKSKVVV